MSKEQNISLSEEQIKYRYQTMLPYLSEQTKRIWAAAESLAIGRGGNALVSKATGISRMTIDKGKQEIEERNIPSSSITRKKGGGRKKLAEISPDLLQIIDKIVDPETRGDPESPLRWTCKSTYQLAEALNGKGYKISQKTVYTILRELGYSLQSNRKRAEGEDHPDRDAQFHYINKLVNEFQKENQPVISVDAKKKENIGNFANHGKEWEKQGSPRIVNTYDFPDKEKGKACPYGIFDIANNEGWVNVGISRDTAEFAVESIRRWWKKMGSLRYPTATKLLITADGGGSNGWRTRLWKREIQSLANEIRLSIHICHFPPGTSKWNKIEHRLFSFISKNWRGKPLDSLAAIVNLIENTTTKKGLQVKAELDENIYEKGIKVEDEEIESLSIKPDEFHGEWNYKISPI
jgi:transposase